MSISGYEAPDTGEGMARFCLSIFRNVHASARQSSDQTLNSSHLEARGLQERTAGGSAASTCGRGRWRGTSSPSCCTRGSRGSADPGLERHLWPLQAVADQVQHVPGPGTQGGAGRHQLLQQPRLRRRSALHLAGQEGQEGGGGLHRLGDPRNRRQPPAAPCPVPRISVEAAPGGEDTHGQINTSGHGSMPAQAAAAAAVLGFMRRYYWEEMVNPGQEQHQSRGFMFLLRRETYHRTHLGAWKPSRQSSAACYHRAFPRLRAKLLTASTHWYVQRCLN